jgi:hypothetical protein
MTRHTEQTSERPKPAMFEDETASRTTAIILGDIAITGNDSPDQSTAPGNPNIIDQTHAAEAGGHIASQSPSTPQSGIGDAAKIDGNNGVIGRARNGLPANSNEAAIEDGGEEGGIEHGPHTISADLTIPMP